MRAREPWIPYRPVSRTHLIAVTRGTLSKNEGIRHVEGDDTDTSRGEEHWNHDDAKPAHADLSRDQTLALRSA